MKYEVSSSSRFAPDEAIRLESEKFLGSFRPLSHKLLPNKFFHPLNFKPLLSTAPNHSDIGITLLRECSKFSDYFVFTQNITQ
jgi:hypothetical protein